MSISPGNTSNVWRDMHRHSISSGPNKYKNFAIASVYKDRMLLCEIYQNLPYYFPIQNKLHSFTAESLSPIDQWCDKNVIGIWHRMWLCVSWNGSHWLRDEANGENIIFYAFQFEKDAMLFKLRW